MPETSSVGMVSALLAGLVSFLSPCVLPLVPGYLSFIAGTSVATLKDARLTHERLAALGLSALFVAGFSLVFIAMGAGATAVSGFLRAHQELLNILAGAVVILFGLYLVSRLPLPFLGRDLRFHLDVPGGRASSAFVLGLAFAFGWTPCIGPILGTILTLAATQEGVGSGIVLLGFYSLGLGVPFLLAALFTGWFLARAPFLRRAGRWLQTGAGVLLVAMGIAMITGDLSRFAFWILERYPALGAVG